MVTGTANVTGTTNLTGNANITSGNIHVLAQNYLKLFDSDSTNYVALQSPGTVSANVSWTLPTADGTSGYLISTNGAGALSFAANSFLIREPQWLSSGTSYTTPSNCTKIIVELIGGGGAGGAAVNDGTGSGGGGGAYAKKTFTVVGNTAYTYAVGAGGANSAYGTAGSGGDTTFTVGGTTVTAGGGTGGTADSATGGTGGTATNGDVNTSGTGGGAGSGTANNVEVAGGVCPKFPIPAVTALTAGVNPVVASSGVAFGGGGSGAQTPEVFVTMNGGEGAPGVIIVWEFIV